jgi:hypothetical protein
MADEIQHLHVTYNDIHNLIRSATPQIAREFNPDLLIAIGKHQTTQRDSLVHVITRWRVSLSVFVTKGIQRRRARGFFPARVMVFHRVMIL